MFALVDAHGKIVSFCDDMDEVRDAVIQFCLFRLDLWLSVGRGFKYLGWLNVDGRFHPASDV